jgi:hypothetical protein
MINECDAVGGTRTEVLGEILSSCQFLYFSKPTSNPVQMKHLYFSMEIDIGLIFNHEIIMAIHTTLYTQIITTIIQFNSIQFFIIYVPSQQPQGQLQTEHRLDTSNYIMDKHYIIIQYNSIL